MNRHEHRPTAQRGAALLIGLLLLLVATLVAVAAMQGSQFQERMASNHYNKAISFHAAEVGATRFIEAINQNGPMSGNQIEQWRKTQVWAHTQKAVRQALVLGLHDGLLTATPAPANATIYGVAGGAK